MVRTPVYDRGLAVNVSKSHAKVEKNKGLMHMRKCDFCKNEPMCSGVQRSECIVRDYSRFKMERSPADDETTIVRLLVEAGGVFNPTAVAKYLVKNGVGMKG